MRIASFVPWLLACALSPAALQAQEFSGESLGIHLQGPPELAAIPGSAVLYAPQAKANYFFHDGRYWAYQAQGWFAGTRYDGPWDAIDPDAVPVALLRVPVRYFRNPPAHFSPWSSDSPPRWDQFWGADWEQRHPRWNEWTRQALRDGASAR